MRYVTLFFFFNDTATTEIYTLSLHDALPILAPGPEHLRLPREAAADLGVPCQVRVQALERHGAIPRPIVRPVDEDRKSTRLNSSHANISYAVFCLKKKTKTSYYTLSLNTIFY